MTKGNIHYPVIGTVDVKVIAADFKETKFCLSEFDDTELITKYVKEGTLKMGDKVKIFF